MKLLGRTVLTTLVMTLVLASMYNAGAQTKSTTKAAVKSAVDKHKRLPTYYGQLDLDDTQKESVYKVRSEFGPKIDALEEQIEQLRDEMEKECEGVLTTAQKKTLTELKSSSKKPKAADAKEPGAKAAAKASTKKTAEE